MAGSVPAFASNMNAARRLKPGYPHIILSLMVGGVAATAYAQRPNPPGDRTGAHEVEIPTAAPQGPKKEADVLLETRHLKLQRLVLRGKTKLPPHAAAEPVLIQALAGEATVKASGKTMKLDPRHAVVLAPNVEHEVIPASATLELLIVRKLAPGRGPGRGRGMGPGPGR